MNPLLARQLRKHFSPEGGIPEAMRDFLEAVSSAYQEHDEERRLLEHTLEVTSEELNEANERLRRESEHKLLTLSRHYLHTLECQQGMILRVSRVSGGFVHTLCRGQLAVRLGWLPASVEGRGVNDFAGPGLAPLLEDLYARAWAGGEGALEREFSEQGIVILARVESLREEGRVVELIVSAVDITERKRTERALVAAKERAESADRAKSEFLAVMSHEIRTPLNAVLGFNSLLESSPLDRDQRAWVETIQHSGRALLSLLNDILDFSKIEAGQLHLSLQPCLLLEELASVVGMYQAVAAAKGVELRLVRAADLPEVITTDSARLRQVLVNLLSNAVKFTREGFVCVTASIAAAGGEAGNFVLQVDVSDTGIGIPESLHDRIFRPFTQVDSSSTRQHGGTGLGLAISQRLVQALGGSLAFTSTQGRGSTFTLRLPTFVSLGLNSTAAGEAGGPSRRLPVMRVLVAEDHPHNRELIMRLLSRQGIRPDMVDNGLAAVEAAGGRPYDVVFMDVRMPGIDGLEATRRIRSAGMAPGAAKPPRIVAVTANAFEEEKRMCFEAGMDAVILKPFVSADLLRELHAAAGIFD